MRSLLDRCLRCCVYVMRAWRPFITIVLCSSCLWVSVGWVKLWKWMPFFLHVFNSFYLVDSFAARNVVGFPTVSYFMSQARLEARSLQPQSSHPLQVRQPVTRESCLCFSILFHDELSTPLSRDVNCHFLATTAAVHRVSDFFSSKEIIFSASSCSSCVGSLEMSL